MQRDVAQILLMAQYNLPMRVRWSSRTQTTTDLDSYLMHLLRFSKGDVSLLTIICRRVHAKERVSRR